MFEFLFVPYMLSTLHPDNMDSLKTVTPNVTIELIVDTVNNSENCIFKNRLIVNSNGEVITALPLFTFIPRNTSTTTIKPIYDIVKTNCY